MAKLFDKDGKEVEAFTADELKAKQEEAVEEFKKANPDKTADLTKAESDLKAAQDKIKELEEGGGSDADKKKAADAKKEAETALEGVKTEFAKQMKDFKDQIFGGKKTAILDKLAGGDVEKRKKIEFEYDNFKGEPANEVEMQERLVKAATIVTGSKPAPNFMDAMTSGNGKDNGGSGKAGEETPGQKAIRNALGITDADAAKHAPKEAGAN